MKDNQMKRRFSTSLGVGLSLALLSAPMAMAQQWQGHPPAPHGDYGHGTGHQWHHGDRFTGHREVVSNWSHYHLRRPPHGYEWVHDGNQLVMIAVGTGLVASALANGY
jgi:Ni/Co efflux regulator RcnB